MTQQLVTPAHVGRSSWMRHVVAVLVVLLVHAIFDQRDVASEARRLGTIDRRMLALVPDSDGTAMALWETTALHRRERQWVGRHDHATLMWSVEVPGRVQFIGAQSGIAIGKHLVVFRYVRADRRSLAVRALDKRDGALLWDTELVRFADAGDSSDRFMDANGIYVSLLMAGDQVVAAVGEGEATGERLMTLDRRTGQVISTDSIRQGRTPRRIGDRLLIGELGDVLVWGGRAAKPTRHSADVVCALRGEPIAISGGYTTPYSFTRLGDGTSSALRTTTELERGRAAHCAEYDGNLIVVFELQDHVEHSVKLAVFRSDGSVRHLIELPATTWMLGMDDPKNPDVAMLSGQLTRYVPFVERTYPEPGRLLMLDLEQGTIAWHSPPQADALHWELFRAGSAWFWTKSQFVIRFDGTTGHLTKAAGVRGYLDYRSFSAARVGSGAFWLYESDSQPALVIDRLALDTLTLDGASPFEVVDVTAEIRKNLNAP